MGTPALPEKKPLLKLLDDSGMGNDPLCVDVESGVEAGVGVEAPDDTQGPSQSVEDGPVSG